MHQFSHFSLGSGGDFSNIQAALDGCRGPPGDTNVTLLLTGTFVVGSPGGLNFPASIENLVIESANGNPADAIIEGYGYLTSSIYRYPAFFFVNVTFNFGNTNQSLFVPQLTNQNLTITGCIFTNVSAQSAVLCSNTTQAIICNYEFELPFYHTPVDATNNYNLSLPAYQSVNYTAIEAPTGPNGTLQLICPDISQLPDYITDLSIDCSLESGLPFSTEVPLDILSLTKLSILPSTNYSLPTLIHYDAIYNNTNTMPPSRCNINYTLSMSIAAPYLVCLGTPTLYLINQEACLDNVFLTLINNTFDQVPNGIINAMGLQQFDIQDNEFPNCGNNISANSSMLRVRLSELSTTVSRLNENNQWR
jgi:hypothetical protein